MCRKLSSLDILAPPISLGIKGSAFLATKTGGAFSLAAVLTFLGLAVYSVIQALRTDKPQVLMEYSAAQEFPAIDIIRNKQIPVILLSRPGMLLNLTEFPQFVHIRMSIKKQIMTSPITVRNEEIPLKLVPCGKLPAETLQKFYVDQSSKEEKFILLNNGLCPDITGHTVLLQGKASQMTRTTLEITVYPCVPELLLPNQTCAPENILSQVAIYLTQATVNLDLTNYESPMSYSWDTETDFRFAYGQSLRARANMKIVEVRNNEWGLYAGATVASTAQIDTVKTNLVSRNPSQTTCSLSQVDSGSGCEPLAIFSYTSGRKKEIFTRSYSGLLGIVASVGGIRALIFTLFFYFHMLFSSFSVKARLVELVFGKTAPESRESLKSVPLEATVGSPCKVTAKGVIEPMRAGPSTSTMHECIQGILDVRNVVQQLSFVHILRNFLLASPSTRKNSLDEACEDVGILEPPETPNKLQTRNSNESTQAINKVHAVSPSRASEVSQSQGFKPSILRGPTRFTSLVKTPQMGETPKMGRFEEYHKPVTIHALSSPPLAKKALSSSQSKEISGCRERLLEEFKEYVATNYSSETVHFPLNRAAKPDSIGTKIQIPSEPTLLIESLMFRASQLQVNYVSESNFANSLSTPGISPLVPE